MLALNPDGSVHNWTYKPDVARLELCHLIARLDLPLCIGETDAFEEYIQRAHNVTLRCYASICIANHEHNMS
jgi:hypothetical protein